MSDEPVEWLVLESYDGGVIDRLLAKVAARSGDSTERLIRAVRQRMRSKQPATHYVMHVSDLDPLASLAADDQAGERKAQIQDVLAIVRGEVRATVVDSRWGLGSGDFDPTIELYPFWEPPAFEAVVDRFEEQVQGRDPLESVIRGHLWLEASLNALLDEKLPVPDELRGARLSFSQKVSLALALGLIDNELQIVIRKLNKLRNRIAHQLDGDVTPADEAELAAACTGRLRELGHLDDVARPFPEQLSWIITVVVAVLHSLLDRMQAERRYETFQMKRAEKLLEKFNHRGAPGGPGAENLRA